MTDPARSNKHWRQATKLVRGGTRRSNFDETCEAIFLTSGFVYETAEEAERTFKQEIDRYQYSRFGNPTIRMFEERLAAIEGTCFCRATATGMSAVFASMACFLQAGDRVVASRALFGSCHYIISTILPAYGITTEFVDGGDLAQWEAAFARPAAAVFLESPSNPMLDIIDLAAVCRAAHGAGAKVIVDNVFASPLLQRPTEYGADIVVYSATKHIDGQGRCLGGAILTNEADWFELKLVPFVRNTGPTLSPFNGWLLLKGMETLDLRVTRHCRNALAVAEFLEGRPEVARVLYPRLASHPDHALAMKQMTDGGNIVTINLAGSRAQAFRFLDSLQLIDISNNLGDTKSLATHPATTTHQRLTPEERDRLCIRETTVRLSIGIEDIDDLREDLDQALVRAAAA
ncbi:MAG: O-succinylhomoserine sulfhydrylase [Rhodospirillales bacterium]